MQLRIGGAEIGLLAHPASFGEGDVELAFSSTVALDGLQEALESKGIPILRGAADEAFGQQLQVADPDGRKVKINIIEADLIS